MRTMYLILCGLLLSIWSCEENDIIIPPLGPQDQGERVVLIEEFSGVRCPNCPSGTLEIESLKALYPDNLIPITIHAGSFAFPYVDSKYDFNAEDGDAGNRLLEFFGGEPLGYPSAVINRSDFGGASFYKGKNEWGGLVDQIVNQEPTINMDITISYEAATRQLGIEVVMIPVEDVSEDVRLSVLLTESGMIDKQANELDPDGKTEDYLHKYVLRDAISNVLGDVISQPLERGNTLIRNYEYTIPDGFVPENCEVIAFTHYAGGGNAGVIQATHAFLPN